MCIPAFTEQQSGKTHEPDANDSKHPLRGHEVRGIPTQHCHRCSEQDSKSGNSKVDQAGAPESSRRTHEAEYLGHDPDLDSLNRFQMVAQEWEDQSVEGQKSAAPDTPSVLAVIQMESAIGDIHQNCNQ